MLRLRERGRGESWRHRTAGHAVACRGQSRRRRRRQTDRRDVRVLAGTRREERIGTMRLPQRFYRLPVRFDAVRLRDELAALPPEAWAPHPNGDPGNSAVRLISVEGGENDAVNGVMRMTPHLERSPYLRQVLAGFGVVWSRSRLLRLAPGAVVPAHSDINYHWFYRVRLHVPIVTLPEVRFTCDDECVHMAAGEAWVFDNWRVHHVENPTDADRIHLVADTSGTASFWELVAQGGESGRARPAPQLRPRAERNSAHRAHNSAAGHGARGDGPVDPRFTLGTGARGQCARAAHTTRSIPRSVAGTGTRLAAAVRASLRGARGLGGVREVAGQDT